MTAPFTQDNLRGPATIDIDPVHLDLTQEWADGTQRCIRVTDNPDLGVLLRKGGETADYDRQVPHTSVQEYVVLALGVDDGEFDAVQYESSDALLTLTRAIQTLVACRDALERVKYGTLGG